MAYTTESIQKLDFFSAVRKYPGMYIGSKDEDGLHHLAKEIISNSIDEYLNGSCTKIEITLCKDGSLKIVDDGRGIPIGTKSNGKTALELCFTEEHAGGKFLNATGESGYNSAGGMHGLGTKCVNALSDWMIVSSRREGKIEKISFINGVKNEHKTNNIKNIEHGLEVHFKPSDKYLETTEFNSDRLKKMIQEFSFLCKGLTFTYTNAKTEKTDTFNSQNGLYDYLEFLNKNKEMVSKPFYFEESEGTYQVEVAFGYNTSYGSEIKLYTNNIPQNKGTHLTGFKTALTSTLNTYAKDKKWLKEKEENLTGADYEEGLLLIINFKMIDPVFKGQNKEELSSSEGRTYVQKFSAKALKELFDINEKEVKKIFEKAYAARRAREAAKKARDAARQPKEKGLKAKMAISNKFIDCVDKNPKNRNLLLVEGLSAGSSAIEARNAKTDCIYMLRGKIISPLKTPIDKILANQEMSDIIRVVGGGFGNNKFDISKINFDKIVITSDQDSDGADIALLLTTFFFTYMRPLVEAGKLYRAVTPLYILRKNEKEIYFYSDKEMEEWGKKNSLNGWDILRCKGLGELNAADLHRVCFENQRFKRITVSDAKEAEKLLEILQGSAVTPRKNFNYENAEHLGFNFD